MTLTLTRRPDGKRADLASPYHPNFPSKARAMGGKWNASQATWTFDVRDIERVRSACLEVYGVDPLAEPDESPELVTVRLALDTRYYGSELWMFGRELVNRPGRDNGVRLGAGVVIISG